MLVPFNQPAVVGEELRYIRQAIENRHLSGNGPFTQRCQSWLESMCGAERALLTHSATAALEMAALLLDIGPGDEVIMPSFTFVSTANAVALRGGVPVFVDIRPDTLNLDESKLEQALTARTRAIFVVHYAGVACEMDGVMEFARRHGLAVVEDAAQGLLSSYRDRPLGSIGDLGVISFHETKNVIAGEGGALLVNRPELVRRAEIIWEKGTDRTSFARGEVARYTWQDLGSSYVLSEILAAFLWGQLEQAAVVTEQRMVTWRRYFDSLAGLEDDGEVKRPTTPAQCVNNGHLFYLILSRRHRRAAVLEALCDAGVHALFHYVPLHSSPAGRRLGRPAESLDVTDDLSERLIRLPLWHGMTDQQIKHVIATAVRVLERTSGSRGPTVAGGASWR